MITMKMFKKKDLIKALTKKGFNESEGKHHKLVLIVDGKSTTVYTIFSHGGGDPGKDLLSKIKKDLKFVNQDEFESFVDCTKKYEEYISELQTKGVI